MSEVSKIHEGQEPEEATSETLQDTGVEIYHATTGTHYTIKAKVKQGEGKVFVNGMPVTELIESGRIKRIEELLRVLNRERLKALDIELEVGDLNLPDVLSPPILAYAIAEALTNLLGRL
ncbi:hypothetical protein [Fervidibacter sacchari]